MYRIIMCVGFVVFAIISKITFDFYRKNKDIDAFDVLSQLILSIILSIICLIIAIFYKGF